MRKMRRKASVLSVVVGLAMILAAETSYAAEGAVESHLAVVNAEDVFNSYEKVKAITKALKERFAPKEKELMAEKRKLEDDKNTLADEQSASKNKVTMDLLKRTNELRVRMFQWEEKAAKLTKEREKVKKEKMEEVLRDIRAAIRTVARKNGYDVVLHAPSFDLDAPAEDETGQRRAAQTATELLMRFRSNPVLYFDPKIDITQKVVDHLNAALRSEGEK